MRLFISFSLFICTLSARTIACSHGRIFIAALRFANGMQNTWSQTYRTVGRLRSKTECHIVGGFLFFIFFLLQIAQFHSIVDSTNSGVIHYGLWPSRGGEMTDQSVRQFMLKALNRIELMTPRCRTLSPSSTTTRCSFFFAVGRIYRSVDGTLSIFRTAHFSPIFLSFFFLLFFEKNERVEPFSNLIRHLRMRTYLGSPLSNTSDSTLARTLDYFRNNESDFRHFRGAGTIQLKGLYKGFAEGMWRSYVFAQVRLII